MRARIPAISSRDTEIADLRRQLRTTTKERASAINHAADLETRKRTDVSTLSEKLIDVPSYRRNLHAERRIAAHLAALHGTDRYDPVIDKLRSYSFAQSNGVAVPKIFACWDTIDEMVLDELPNEVVIKSSGGTNGRGVLPLRRIAGEWQVVTGSDTLSSEEVVGRFRSFESEKRVFPPYFAEELLGGGGASLPIDFKAYAFYGEVGHVLLRSVGAFGDKRSVRFRAMRPDGSDLGPVCAELEYDESIPIPANLEELLEVVRVLSIAVSRPFMRVDLYDHAGRVVFGEFAPRPGGPLRYEAEFDAHLGHLWERAQARLTNDLVAGASDHLRFGPHSRDLSIGGSAPRRFDANPG